MDNTHANSAPVSFSLIFVLILFFCFVPVTLLAEEGDSDPGGRVPPPDNPIATPTPIPINPGQSVSLIIQ